MFCRLGHPLKLDKCRGCTYAVLWSLPADGSCKSLMEDDAEIWPSFMNLDFIPSGDKQPTKIKKNIDIRIMIQAVFSLLRRDFH